MKHFLGSAFALLLCLASTAFAQAAGPERVAVAANGRTPSAAVSADMKSKGVRPVEFKGAANDAARAALGQK